MWPRKVLKAKMSPYEALKRENFEKVMENQKVYCKEFGIKNNKSRLKIGDRVLIRKEIKCSKSDKEYEYGGVIDEIIRPEQYKIINDNGIIMRRHESQLKLEGECRIHG
ncbi:hypothetical protein DMUE_2635 [Dictyocoela muelleri]|nr:hypothetical protein DMUE_2635 [Dictyocoela muelleri]